MKKLQTAAMTFPVEPCPDIVFSMLGIRGLVWVCSGEALKEKWFGQKWASS